MSLMQLEEVLIQAVFWTALLSSVAYLFELILRQSALRWVGLAGMVVGAISTIASMVIRYVYAGYPPLSNLFESLIFLIAGIYVLFVLVQLTLKPKFFGLVAAPLVTLLIGFASILPAHLKNAHPLMPALQSYWLKIHVSLMMLSYAAFMLAFAAGIVYLVLHHKAKKEPGFQDGVGGGSGGQMLALEGGMALDEGKLSTQLLFFDDLVYRLILFGFPVLAFGIITGAVWANHAWGTYWSWDPKETWSLITWLVYAGYLHARLVYDWKGSKAAWMAIIGFVSVMVTYLGVNYISTGLHTYGKLL